MKQCECLVGNNCFLRYQILVNAVPGIIIVRHTSLTEEECVWLLNIKSL